MDARSAIYINSIIGKKYKTADVEEKINTVKAVVSGDWSQEDILDVLEQTNFDTQKAVQEILDGNVKPNSNPFHVIGKKQSKTQDDKQNGKDYKSYKHPKGQGQGGQKNNKDKLSGKGQRAPKTKFEKKKDKGNSGQAPAVNGTANANTESENSQTQPTENKVVVEDKKPEEQQHTNTNVSTETTPVVAPTSQPTPAPTPAPSTTTPTTSAPTTTTPPTTHTSKPRNQHPRNQWKVKNSGAQSQEQTATTQQEVQPSAESTGASVVLPPSAKHALQESAPIRFGGASQAAPSRASVPAKTETQHSEPVVAQTSVAKSDAVVQSNTATQQTAQQTTPSFANQGQVPFMNFGYPFFQNPYQMNPSGNVSNSSTTPAPVPFPFAPHSYFDMAYMWEMMNQYYQQQSQQPTSGSTTPSTSTTTQTQSHFPFFPPGPAPMMNPMMGAFPAYYSYADQHGNTQTTTGTQATSTTPSTSTASSTSSTSAQPSSTTAFPQHFQGTATTGNSRGYPVNYPTADFSQSQMDQQSFGQPSYLGYEYNYYNNNQQQKNYNPQNRFP